MADQPGARPVTGGRGVRAQLAVAGPWLLAGELAVFAAWGALAPPLSGPLDVVVDGRAGVEAADQVLPAVVALAIAGAAVLAVRRGLAGWLVVTAAGAVMTATHAAYLADAVRGDADGVKVVFLTAPGIAILLLGASAAAATAISSRTRSAAEPASSSVSAPRPDPVPDDPLIA